MSCKLTLRQAALKVLTERGPMHYKALTKAVLTDGLAFSDSKTPTASVNAVIAVDLKRHGTSSAFVRVKPGVFAARAAHEDGHTKVGCIEVTLVDQRVRVPLYPKNDALRCTLSVWSSHPRSQVTGLRADIQALTGTPTNQMDWSDPDAWIADRLTGVSQVLAASIWKESAGSVNPRHTYGAWLMALKYELIVDGSDGLLMLSDTGRDFVDNPAGKTVTVLDELEGLLKLLALVAESGPARFGDLLDDWNHYLQRRFSPFVSVSTQKDSLRRRLRNLLSRELLSRSGTVYSISGAGLAYLNQQGDEDAIGTEDTQQIWSLVRRQTESVRESLRELLLDMDPIGFEYLIKRLLEEMNYQDVEVTTPGNDGGVDVIAKIELGITSVKEVVQVKRHRRTIGRKDLDALRGSLYRFNAVRGTIITTSRFSKGTRDAAFAPGAAPITLIDGDKLINLLIEYGIGVRKKTVDVLEVEAGDFAGGLDTKELG
jgi:restriction system protein